MQDKEARGRSVRVVTHVVAAAAAVRALTFAVGVQAGAGEGLELVVVDAGGEVPGGDVVAAGHV